MQYKYNSKQRYRSIQGLRSFKDTLPTKVKKILKKKGYIFSETLDNWRYIVGDELFKVCYPKSFKSSNKFSSSTLSIMVKRGHEIEMEYSKNEIMKKMNIYFNESIVEKIKLITFEGNQQIFNKEIKKTVTKNQYEKKITNINNEKIKSSLLELSKLFNKK
tara:strand:- start:470 stop:952 length:483 start_codon:yes stop_codon:yes gene_type:complete